VSASARFFILLLTGLAVVLGGLWIVGGRRLESSAEILINAPPAHVFSWLVDPDRRVQWVTGLSSASVAGQQPDGTVESYQSVFRKGTRDEAVEEQVRQLEPGKFFSLTRQSGGVHTVVVYRLSEREHGTRLRCEWVESAANPFSRLLFAVREVPSAEQIDAELKRLRPLAEKSSPAAPLFGEATPADAGRN
jgi:uncharacterized protein YndB with AHSA1/START domain